MPANVGDQTVTILYYMPANSADVNKRFKGIRQTGIYSGGYLSVVDSSHALLSLLICEISDSSHQIRVETALTVNIAVAVGTSYVVLRWIYTGSTADYMEILAVATPAANDLIVGKCSFTGGGNLQGFDYSERSTPNTQDLFLKVEAPDSAMVDKMKVRVRAGRIQTNVGVISINDQPTPSAFTHSGGGSTEYGLVYIDTSGNVQIVNANGNTSIPSYNGKMVLAIVAIVAATATIVQSMITDVRNWITAPVIPDDVTIEFNNNGLLQIIESYILDLVPSFGTWTTKDSLNNALVENVVYKAGSDGFICAWHDGTFVPTRGYTDGNNPPTALRQQLWGDEGTRPGITIPVKKDDYWKVTGAQFVSWLPVGSGTCVKQ